MKLLTSTTALAPPLAGIGHYTTQLLVQLMKRAFITEIKGVSPSGTQLLTEAQITTMIAQGQSVRGAEAAGFALLVRQLLRQVPFARDIRSLLARHCLARRRRELADYVYWEPNFLRLPVECPTAVTVYDLSHVSYPEFHPASRVRLLRKGIEESIAGAQQVIAISEFTRQELIHHLSIAPEKIALVPPAVSDAFREEPTEEALCSLRSRYRLPEQFLLSVGTLEPRKNTRGLIQAYSALPALLRKRYPLVLVGAKGWHTEQIDTDMAQLEARGELIRLGYVSQADLPLLYRASFALAYISFYEGYGMPVAEAMVSGVPVLTSNCASMPEVARGSALLVDPHDQSSIKHGLERLLSDSALRQRCIAKGLGESRENNWSRSADSLISVLSRLSH